jgi:urease accessory protein
MSAALPITAVPACASGWQALLDLRFGHRAGQGSVLAHARHSGPLRVEEGAILEWLPQENLLFAGADATMALDLELAPGARAIGWDAVVLGRYGAGEHWNHATPASPARLRVHNRLACGGRPLWLEQGELHGGDALLSSPVAWAGFPIQASLWAVAPGAPSAMEALNEQLAATLPWSDEVRAGASLLAGQGAAPSVLLLRVLARRMEAARAVLHEGWRLLRPALLNQQARPPRLWAT